MDGASLVHLFGPKWRGVAKEYEIMLWTILVILLVLWLVGFLGHFGGNLIHLLLLLAVIVLVYNLVIGRRTV